MDLKKLEELKKQYGDRLFCFEITWKETEKAKAQELEVYCIRPDTVVVDRFMAEITKKPSQAIKNFVASCLVEPTWKDLALLFEKYPGVYMALANKLNDLLGFSAEVVQKN